MNARQASQIATILSTLAEVDGAPESILYISLGSDLGAWERLKGIMLAMRWIAVSGHYVTLTDVGRAVVRQLEAARAG